MLRLTAVISSSCHQQCVKADASRQGLAHVLEPRSKDAFNLSKKWPTQTQNELDAKLPNNFRVLHKGKNVGSVNSYDEIFRPRSKP